MSLFKNILTSIMEPQKYSTEWYRSLSDDELKTEREIVRLKHCSGDTTAYIKLEQFDREIRRREELSRKGKPETSSVHWTDANRWDKD